MRFILFLAALLAAPLAAAQTSTTEAMTLWVNTTGSDGYSCLFSNQPCKTLEGAWAKVPDFVKHPVTINVAAGSYAGAQLGGRFIDDNRNNPVITVRGALADAVLTTGSARGTATAATAASNATFATLTDSTQTWTPNNLRGKLLEIVEGTNAGDIALVSTNTATVITIAGGWLATPTTTSKYVIRDWATSITGTVPGPSNVGAAATTTGQLYVNTYMKGRARNNGGLVIERLRFAPTVATTDILLSGQSARVQHNKFQDDGVTTTLSSLGVYDSGFLVAQENYLVGGTTQKSFILTSSAGGGQGLIYSLVGNVQDGGGFFLQSIDAASLFATRNDIKGPLTQSAAFRVDLAYDVLNTGNHIDCVNNTQAGYQAIGTQGSNRSGGVFSVTADIISNCGIGVWLQGPVTFSMGNTAGLTGTGNSTAYLLSEGGQVRLLSSATMTGTTEISLDGTAYTLAALRALSPKRITNAGALTSIYEP